MLQVNHENLVLVQYLNSITFELSTREVFCNFSSVQNIGKKTFSLFASQTCLAKKCDSYMQKFF